MPVYASVIVVGTPENFVGAFIPDWNPAPTVLNRHPLAWDPALVLSSGPFTNNTPVSIESEGFGGARIPNFGDDFYNPVLIETTFIDARNVSSDQVRAMT